MGLSVIVVLFLLLALALAVAILGAVALPHLRGERDDVPAESRRHSSRTQRADVGDGAARTARATPPARPAAVEPRRTPAPTATAASPQRADVRDRTSGAGSGAPRNAA